MLVWANAAATRSYSGLSATAGSEHHESPYAVVVTGRAEQRAGDDARVWVVAREEASWRVEQGAHHEGVGCRHGGRARFYSDATPLQQRQPDEFGPYERERPAALRPPQEHDVGVPWVLQRGWGVLHGGVALTSAPRSRAHVRCAEWRRTQRQMSERANAATATVREGAVTQSHANGVMWRTPVR